MCGRRGQLPARCPPIGDRRTKRKGWDVHSDVGALLLCEALLPFEIGFLSFEFAAKVGRLAASHCGAVTRRDGVEVVAYALLHVQDAVVQPCSLFLVRDYLQEGHRVGAR